MKKKFFTKSIVCMLLVTVLAVSLTACRKPVDPSQFDDTFGAKGREQNQTNLLSIEIGEGKDNVKTAYDKAAENYKRFEYVAVRGKVTGTTAGTAETHQTIYSTTIKEFSKLTNETKIFHEDASVSNMNSIIKPSIVQMIQKRDSKGNVNTKTRLSKGNNVDAHDEGYPKMKKIDEEKKFDTEKKYLDSFHQDLLSLLPYVVDVSTINDSKSSLTKNADGYIELKIELKNLQEATKEKRETIVIKTGYSNQVIKAEEVIYKELSFTILLWPSNYIRQISCHEVYTINPALGEQTCTLDSEYYFSNDSSELPMGNFEF